MRDKLANWEAFLHAQEDINPLVRMAVGHYQFEAIHPFTDGNGRTGRLLYLVERGLLSQPTLYLSGHINRTRHDYYRLLLDVTTSERWGDWILYMLKAIRETAAWTSSKVRATDGLCLSKATMRHWCTRGAQGGA
ncbi:MAG: Fic family protein [Chromatocurvus sp.]